MMNQAITLESPSALPTQDVHGSAHRPMSRRRRLLMAVCALTLATLGALVIAEVGLRMLWDRPSETPTMQLFDGPTYYYNNDALQCQLPRPDVQGVHPGFNAAFSTNSQGLRGDREFIVPKPAGVKRVVVLGDSFAWGYGVENDEIFTSRLGEQFPDVEVVNLGVIGFHLRSEIAYLKHTGLRYKPDVVLLAVCQNDIKRHRASSSPAGQVAPSPSQPIRDDTKQTVSRLRGLKESLRTYSYTYALVQQGVNRNKSLAQLMIRVGLKEELAGFDQLDDNLHASLKRYPPQVEAAMEMYLEDLRELKVFLDEQGIALIVALIPALQTVDGRALDASISYTKYDASDFDLDKAYQRIAEHAEGMGIAVINPVQAFRDQIAQGDVLYLPRDMHFNAAGHQRFAERIAPGLAEVLNAELAN